jgi:hypothetical protein
MANTGFLSISDLSFDSIKANLKTFLKSKTEFKDYDFEGSNLSALLDILSYNTYMNSFYLNMVGSESFLDSSQMKSSIVSHAKMLNYLPRSKTSARALVTFTIDTGIDTPSVITIPKYYTSRAVVDNVNMEFSTDEPVTITANNGVYQSPQVYIYEGKVVTEYFTKSDSSRFILSSENVDTNSLEVTVINSSIDTANTVYTRAENLYGLNPRSEVYFVAGYNENQYELFFGDDVLGKALVNGNIVKVKYRSTNGELGNKASAFEASSKVDNYSVTVSTNVAAADGSDRENAESIKYNSPRHFASQNRAVTKEDYVNLIRINFPQIKTVNVYGGEDATPPQFGKVIISMIPYGTQPLVSTELKTNIINFLTTKNLTTSPVIIDPEYMYVEIVSDVRYNPSLTSKSTTQIKAEIVDKIRNYSDNYLTEFGNDLRKSKLVSAIDSADSSITSNQTSLRAIYRITPTKGTSTRVNFTFSNTLYRPYKVKYTENEAETVKSDAFTYYKDGAYFNAYLSDDGVGKLRIYYVTADSKQVILEEDIGTVDYDTGELLFYLDAYDYNGYINIYAKTLNDDIIVQESKYLQIDFEKLYVTVNVFRQ